MLCVKFISSVKLWVTFTFECIKKGYTVNLAGYYPKRYTF